MTGGSSRDERKSGAEHRLVGAQHALRVDDAFRLAGGAGGKKEFRDRIGRDAWHAPPRPSPPAWSRQDERRRFDRRSTAAPATTISTPAGTVAAMARANAVPLAANTRPGVRISIMALSLPKSSRDKRIGDRNRRIGNADMHGGEAEQRVLDVVAGQDRDRPLGREIALEQRRRDRAHRRQRLRIAQRAPAATWRRAGPERHASGAASAQCTSRSVIFSGCGGSGCGERIRIVPSPWCSVTTSGRASLTGRSGASFFPSKVFAKVFAGALGMSAARHFGCALLQKRLEPFLGLFVALRDRGGERLGHESRPPDRCGRSAAADASRRNW